MSLPRFLTCRVSGWGRRPVEECDVYRPEGLDELREIVANAPQESLIPRGLGRSYGDASLNSKGAIIASDSFDLMHSFDPDTATLHCQSAVSLAEIIEHFLPRGFFFPVTPGTKTITVGGAIAADVHGKNHHRSGSMSAWLKELRLLRADGEILVCSREQNADAFWATIGGMGLTGVILDAELQLKAVETAYMSADYDHTPNVDALLDRMAEAEARFDYAVAWIDCQSRGRALGRGVLLCANHASRDELPPDRRTTPYASASKWTVGLPVSLPNFSLNPWTNRIFNEAYRQVSGLARTVRGPSMSASPGKVLVDGVTEIGGEKVLVLKLLQGRNPEWVGRPFYAKYDPQASWLDDLEPAFGEKEFFFEPGFRRLREARAAQSA